MPENTESTTCPFLTAGELSAVTVGDKTMLLDVRSPIEFEAESIPGSVNLLFGVKYFWNQRQLKLVLANPVISPCCLT